MALFRTTHEPRPLVTKMLVKKKVLDPQPSHHGCFNICINTLVWSSMTLYVAMASPFFGTPCMVYHGIATDWLIRLQFTKQLNNVHSTSPSSHVQPSINHHFCGLHHIIFPIFQGSNAYVNPEHKTLLMNWGYPNN